MGQWSDEDFNHRMRESSSRFGRLHHALLTARLVVAIKQQPLPMSEVIILLLRLGVDAHHAQVTIGDKLAIRVFREKGLRVLNVHCS